MRIISKKALLDFWIKHPNAKSSLEAWHRVVSKSDFKNFIDLKDAFNSVDYTSPYTIFNIGGNNYRLIVSIHYNTQHLYIREVFTHAEYDKWNKGRKRNV